jgi:hypothetical protein
MNGKINRWIVNYAESKKFKLLQGAYVVGESLND